MTKSILTLTIGLAALANSASADQHKHVFVATSDKSFHELMDEAMHIMHEDMHLKKKSDNPDADFIKMMVPHHQGAVDMAKGLLLYAKDKRLKNLALQIIANQEAEIKAMNDWLKEMEKR